MNQLNLPFFRLQASGWAVGALLGLSACGPTPPPATQNPPAAVAAPPVPAAAPAALAKAAADSATQTAVRFFAWYQRHRARITDLGFLASATDDDTTQLAGVRFTQVNEFLRLLRGSRCVSPAYLAGWDAFFHDKADKLAHDSADGDVLAEGFTYELVLYSQEGDHYLEKMAAAPKHVRSPAPNQAVVQVDFAPGSSLPDQKQFYLRRYPSGWLIDSIR